MGPSPNQRGLSRKHVMHAIDNSLKRLGMEYVDLYQIHRFDYGTPVEETIEALHDVVKAGKARYIGASSMYAWQFAEYLHRAKAMGMTQFVTMQNFYNLVYREEEREMLPLSAAHGIGVIPWSPASAGFFGPQPMPMPATSRPRAPSPTMSSTCAMARPISKFSAGWKRPPKSMA